MAEQHDITPHTEMWHIFTRMTTYGCVGMAILLILMAIFLL
ncbi:MAG TPA: aa3-type cytochrome c oxidase subunit IV [Alphaproteobacteria bacterium]|nr:aa3-type cytochrome c oxidase subunit IV [Alphaproteobacteria bacterium]